MTVKAQNLLVPVDGSDNAERVVDKAIDLFACGLVKEVHLLNVQHAIPSAVTTFVGKKATAGYHHDEGKQALAKAEAKLERAGVPHQIHIGVGKPAEIIADFAKELGSDAILMGTRGLGGGASAVLGSVTRDVIAEVDIPVTLIK